MKLHLPKMLAAALLAASTALIAGQQAQAATRTTVTTHTTQAGDVTYNGYVFTMLLSPAKAFATRDFKEAQYVQGAWVDVDPVYHSSNSAIQTPLGNGSFWHMYCSSTNVSSLPYGNTLHLTGATGEVKVETNFSDFSIGGLIADDNSSPKNPTYWFWKNNNMTLNGTGAVNMDVNSHVRFSYASTVDMMKGGTWNIHSGKSLTFDNNSSSTATTFNFFEDQALTVKGGGTLNLGRSSNGTYNVNMKSGSSLHVTENSTVVMGAAGTLTANGAITVDEGSTLTITSLTTTLGHTVTNNGNIHFASDTVTLGSLGGFDSAATYTDYNGEDTGNGFAGTIVYTIIQGTGTSNLAKVNYGTQTAVALTDGKLTVGGDMDYTKYYLNTNDTTISVKSASEYAAQHEGTVLSTVYVKGASDTVDVDADFSGAIEVSGTGAVLNIKEGSVFSGTLTSATIQGAGTYALASGSKTMVGTLAAGSGWTGTVALSNISGDAGNNLNLNTYGHDGSKVEINGFTGYFLKAQAEFAPELVLGASGLTLNNGYSTIDGGGSSKFTFAGGVSGEGDMVFNKDDGNVTQHLYFTGDVADWTGALNVVDHFTVYAQFSGTDKEVGAAIVREIGTLNVEVGTGSDTSNVTFNNAITNASSLTVQEGASATLKEASTIGTLTSTGSLTVDAAGKTVSITGEEHTLGKTITLTNGELSLAGAYNLDAMEPTDYVEEYVGPEEGVAAGSGFHKVSGSVQVVTIDNGTLSLAEGATFSYQEASVTVNDQTGAGTFGGVDLTTLWVNGTDPVSYNAAQEYAEQQAPGTIVSTVRLNYDGATITMDRAGASVALVLSDTATTATVNATADTTISSITGWTGKELVIDGTSTVTTGALALDNDNTKLTVVEGATLDIAGNNHNLTLQHGSATINGTVTIAHELDLSKNKSSDAELVIGSTGDVTATDGLWLHGGHHFTILDEGQFTTKGLTFIGQGAESTISYNDVATADDNYDTNKVKYVITNMTIQANKDVTIGNTLVNSTVVTGDHAVTLNTDATKVIVSDGGTFTKGAGVTVEDITVEGRGTVAGDVEMADVTIAVDATATFGGETAVSDIDDGVFIFNLQNPIKVQNIGQEAAKYTGLHQEGMKVSADTLSSSADGVTVENTVAVEAIQHMGTGALTLTHVDTEPLKAVEVTNGSLYMQDAQTATLSTMEIAAGSTVSMTYTDEQQATLEGTITITESLVAGGATLYANLTLVGHELGDETPNLLYWDLNGAGENALTLGSTLMLNTESGLIQLDDDTMQAIADLENRGDYLELVVDAGTGLEYIGDGWFDGVFSRTYTNADGGESTLGGDYNVQLLENGNFGIVKFSDVPEPTTGTLSLLALAALAARRRKH